MVRGEWNSDSVLITDDFSMGAVYQSPEGIAGGSIAALRAGIDLILISFDTDQYFAIMASLVRAAARGALRPQDLEASDQRLSRLHARLP